ncbi:ArsR family transcriptional regulator [Devosia limi DSM 17137]|uniref:ArsR family transcriptional regulator n=2 Tax=Devosia limi DSM 17137 TaxID=1121477 RepID=A0A0F5L295_9HYPH|nr:metalloregulator ArsR/SmtB family transcription factor [Devosia limi]KKB76329.1 ArsR family transcriptional regulator [Devosia limi DSM 17137]
MDMILAALADSARWRILELLAERPRSVGELAELTGARQPQTTKHLQTLGKAGLVTMVPLGQRRVYAMTTGPLLAVQQRLGELVAVAEIHGGEIDVVMRYRAAIEADRAKADGERWADGRSFVFERRLDAPPELVWQHWVDAERLASWWAPPSMTVTECELEPRPGGRAVLEYRDAEGRYRSEGRVEAAEAPDHLVFGLSVLDAAGAIFFTGHYDLRLAAVAGGTTLQLGLRITETSVAALPYIAGIETGWGQVLDQLTGAIATFQNTGASQ